LPLLYPHYLYYVVLASPVSIVSHPFLDLFIIVMIVIIIIIIIIIITTIISKIINIIVIVVIIIINSFREFCKMG